MKKKDQVEKACENCKHRKDDVCVVKCDDGKKPLTVARARTMYPGGCDDWCLSLSYYTDQARN